MSNFGHFTLHAITANDPLAGRLHRYLHPVPFAAFTLLTGVLYTWVLPLLNGVPPSQLADWQTVIVRLVLAPIIFGWYAWQPRAMYRLYEALLARAALALGAGGRVAAGLVAPYRSRRWTVLALATAGGITLALGLRLALPFGAVESGLDWAIIAIRLANRFLIAYALIMFVGRQMAVTVGVNRLFRRTRVLLTPLHPDGAGGLRAIGSFALRSAGLVIVVGLLLSLQYVNAQLGGPAVGPEFPFELALYLVAGPAVFFLPLLQAHRQMTIARRQLLMEVASEFERYYLRLRACLAQNEDPAEVMEHLDALQEFYGLAANTPVWPFNIGMLTGFGGLILVPVLVPAVVDAVAGYLAR